MRSHLYVSCHIEISTKHVISCSHYMFVNLKKCIIRKCKVFTNQWFAVTTMANVYSANCAYADPFNTVTCSDWNQVLNTFKNVMLSYQQKHHICITNPSHGFSVLFFFIISFHSFKSGKLTSDSVPVASTHTRS